MSETGSISHSDGSEDTRRKGMTAREALEELPGFDKRSVVAAKVNGALPQLPQSPAVDSQRSVDRKSDLEVFFYLRTDGFENRSVMAK